MARANVPKFGNWENEDNVPYTVFFDKARKTKGGKMINPNDPQENPSMFAPPSSPPTHSNPKRTGNRQDESTGRAAVRPVPDHRKSKDESEYKQFVNSPAQSEMGQKSANESSYGGRGQKPARSTKPSLGSENSIERSPLHPQYQAKGTGRETGSTAWDGKNHDSSHGSGLKSRLKPATRGDESPDSAAVPRFGAWDENNPESAENFTGIFNKMRQERKTPGAPRNMPVGTPKHPSYGSRTQHQKQPKSCLCFW